MTRTTTRLTLFASAACLALVTGLFLSAQQNLTSDLETTAFVCPMHPDYTLDIAGTCPRCGMALVKATPYDVRDYGFEFTTTPALVQPGRPSRWRFSIAHPGTGQPVTKFEPVHERQYHLFVISQDMEHFQHIHPEQQADGTWAIDVTLPKPGYYKVLSDFLPSGGAAQLIARPLVTAGYAGDLTSGGAALVPDASPRKTIDDVTATVSYDPAGFVAGLYGHLIFDLTDTQTMVAGVSSVGGP